MTLITHLCLVCILAFTFPLVAQERSRALGDRSADGNTLLTPAISSVAAHPDDAHWDSRFGMPGLDGEVRAMAADGDWLYIGGLFSFAGNIPASRIVRWNRVTHVWETLGQGEANGTDGVVLAIAVRGDSIYVGGQFKRAGDKSVENIAVWNKRIGTWGEFGEGAGDRYAYIASIITDARNVYAGGRFTSIGGLIVNNVARWDGTSWQRLEGGLNGYCYAMTLDGGKLYAGGTFTTAGAVDANHVAVWNGTLWSSLGAGLDTNVHALVAGNGNLYAGGIFARSGSDSMPFVARWDMTSGTWNALRDTTAEIVRTTTGPPATVYGLALHNDSLFVVGLYDLDRKTVSPNGLRSIITFHILVWDGQWRGLRSYQDTSEIRTTNNAPINAVLVDRDVLYLGGKFTKVGRARAVGADQPAMNMIGWDLHRQQWNVMGEGVNERVTRMVLQGDNVIISGDFIAAGGKVARHIARFDNDGWHSLGIGVSLSDYVDGGTIAALAADEQNVYIGGNEIARIGDYIRPESAEYWVIGAARWDGERWTPMSLGGENPGVGYWPITSFAFSKGRLYAGRYGGDAPYVNLVWWNKDSSAWVGMTEVFEDVNVVLSDAAGDIYLGTTTGIFHWNHTTDSLTLLGTANGYIRSMAIEHDLLYLGGDFTKIGGIDAQYIVKYDIATKQWKALGEGLDHDVPQPRPTVNSIALAEGRVYAGGWFNTAGEVAANNVAVWDGEVWKSLGSGVDGTVDAIVVRGEDVYLGGNFRNVGGTIPSWNFAHWNASALSVEETYAATAASPILRAVPNPASGVIRFHLELPSNRLTEPASLSIYDPLGHSVAVLSLSQSGTGSRVAAYDTDLLAPGIYYCRFQAGATVATAQFIVVR